jgi:hypothetical protein
VAAAPRHMAVRAMPVQRLAAITDSDRAIALAWHPGSLTRLVWLVTRGLPTRLARRAFRYPSDRPRNLSAPFAVPTAAERATLMGRHRAWRTPRGWWETRDLPMRQTRRDSRYRWDRRQGPRMAAKINRKRA